MSNISICSLFELSFKRRAYAHISVKDVDTFGNNDIKELYGAKGEPVLLFFYYEQTSSGNLKEYYEIIDEARPLSGFFPTHPDFFTEMHLHF